jgi:Macrocin-O-methyltransferase (TylF)
MLLRSLVIPIERRRIPGMFIECGSALGGSAIVIASAKRRGRNLKVFDTFGMIPAPTNKDDMDVHARYETIKSGKALGIGGDTYYGYHPDLLREVSQNFAKHCYPIADNNITLVKGLYQDTLNILEPVAFAHIDCDWYESVLTCLKEIVPRLSEGSVMIIDDYYAWSGCQSAVDEFFAGRSGFRFDRQARLIITRETSCSSR